MAARIGLTGGIGSGKSTVAQIFSALGVFVIDADQVARQVVLPGSLGLESIIKRFGSTVLLQDGFLDRKMLSAIVFADKGERRWLEELLHPMIREKMDAMATGCDDPYCLLEIPLLIESDRKVDRIIVVHCSRETRVARLLASREMTREKILQVMDTQASDTERLARADDVIKNEGTEEDLVSQVSALHERLTKRYSD